MGGEREEKARLQVLVPETEIVPGAQKWKHHVLTTGPLANSRAQILRRQPWSMLTEIDMK